MSKPYDLKQILARNIKYNRSALHITQAKLAEFAGISASHVVDIELCRTWVSDKTLAKIAEVFNMEAYELLNPGITENMNSKKTKHEMQHQIAELINNKKNIIRQQTDAGMESLILEIVRLYEEHDDAAG